MDDLVVVYLIPPGPDGGPWRVRSNGNKEREVEGRDAAVEFAVCHARMIEAAGGRVDIQVAKVDGTWEVFSF